MKELRQNKVMKPVTRFNAYNLYRKYCIEHNIESISIKLHGQLCSNFLKFVAGKILDGAILKLPSKIGRLYILGKKQIVKKLEDGTVTLPINWNATKKYWEKNPKAKEEKKVIYFTNEHTNGKIYTSYWDKKMAVLKNKSFYQFVMARDTNREIKNKLEKGVEYLLKT